MDVITYTLLGHELCGITHDGTGNNSCIDSQIFHPYFGIGVYNDISVSCFFCPQVCEWFLNLPWLNSSPPSATNMHQWTGSALVQIMACRLFHAKPLSKPMLGYCQLDSQEQTSVKFQSNYKTFHSRKCIWKYRLRNGGHIVQRKRS